MTAEEQIKALADARNIMDPIRIDFASDKHPAWTLLYHADLYLAKQQDKILREALAPPAPEGFKSWFKRLFK